MKPRTPNALNCNPILLARKINATPESRNWTPEALLIRSADPMRRPHRPSALWQVSTGFQMSTARTLAEPNHAA
eukprot:CAMPEP_0184330648 /NCGR_PEP_ID=MMETSP1049-20130417/144794_1 /TAXON_ID=77928 /ORGANISM="Proteomonas sulcata, Strain CCMP704" /LENGTH=73 /DNA_ID=CAMNT_0026653097 /DNA_START=79 /DNA_END=300 /DNA_ORIENTATION=+